MSNFTGRRAPNVSQYIANLNTIPSPYEVAAQQQQENFNLDDDLALFTNAQFFDFDIGETVNQQPNQQSYYSANAQEASSPDNVPAAKGAEFLGEEFQFPDFSGMAHIMPNTQQPHHYRAQEHHAQHQPIQPSPYHPNSAVHSPAASSPIEPQTGDKRKAGALNDSLLEDTSRFAAEEDKRRRNTAASARFRVKKKQREQALERTAKEMTDKCTSLETRIGQLEMENKWLKNLITEKNGSKDEIADMWKKFNSANAASADDASRSTSAGKDGVGTSADLKAESKAETA
ncbi:hypothetical protein L228DRAFT_244709 [Xylona heveae TC161]|uniref:BZIP domain-containing protein n=1 Tax=Xylona heveae (strain CBS 132557 / TC161) TaxID=1328760 RepID=A0A165J6A3_XYLHT|nr:hypothetical protein L228DRAFT_244709 [Xylona heveae TC161]KZF25791.1 hypothetical protein L228DRAFT_244709 [Xylona heveae TC161]